MAGEHGVDQVIKAWDVVVELGNVADKVSMERGGTMAKVAHMTALFDELMALPGLDFEKLSKQAGELDTDDIKKIMDHTKLKLDLIDDVSEAQIEKGLELVVEGYAFLTKVIDFSKEVRK